MKKLLPALLLLVALACATLFNDDRDAVTFGSNPTDAEVYINGTLRGRTPLTIELQPTEEYEIIFRKDGREQAFELTNHVGAGWVILDILGGIIPIVIDAVTGEWQELETKAINVNLPA